MQIQKRHMQFKTMDVILIVLLSVSLMFACAPSASQPAQDVQGQKQEETTGATTASTTAAPATTTKSEAVTTKAPDTLPEVTLRFFFPGDKLSAVDDVWNRVSDLTKDRLNAKFDIIFAGWSDFSDKLRVMAASGDNYDLNFDADWFNFSVMINNGAYLGLNELMPKYAPKLYERYKNMNYISGISVNGQIVAMPWIQEKTSRLVVIWRQDLLDQYGIPTPAMETLEDLEALCKQIKESDISLYPMVHGPGWSQGNLIFMLLCMKNEYTPTNVGSLPRLTFDLNDPACRVIPIEFTDMYREMAVISKRWFENGYVPRDMISVTDNMPFENNTSMTKVHIIDSALSETAFIVPTAKKGYAPIYPDKKFPFDLPLNNAVCLNKNAANPERTLMFMELLHSDQAVYDTVLYGIEGKTYIFDDDTVIFPVGMSGQNSNYMDWTGQWGFWDDELLRPTATRSKEMMAQTKEFIAMPSNVVWPLAGYMIDTDPIKTELARQEAVFQEYGVLIEYGLVDDPNAALDEYIVKLKEAGIDKIVTEVQRQIDEFLK